MFEIITACTTDYGIGNNNSLPWNCPDELRIFREKTMNSILICGSKTAKSLPALPGRQILQLSRNGMSLEHAIEICKNFPDKKVFIAGGGQIYDLIFENYLHMISKLHISIMKGSFTCNTYIKKLNLKHWVILEETSFGAFTHYVMKYDPREGQYLDLLSCIPMTFRKTRNSETASVFGKHLKFDLSDGSFPMLTTKKMFFRGIVEELLFFIRGDTDSKFLESKGVSIWKGNTSRDFLDSIGKTDRREGLMGPMYGYQWRFFNATYDEKTGNNLQGDGIDQLSGIVDLIRNDPYSRRILLTSFNPVQARSGVLYPCHSIVIQFYVSDQGNLDMFCYNRSQDLFLGTPFNIASSGLLLLLISKITGKQPGVLHMSLGDVHLYKDHYERAQWQSSRQPYPFPQVKILKEINSVKDLEMLTSEDFRLDNYKSHKAIKAEMVA
jgi:thymidylate synthase